MAKIALSDVVGGYNLAAINDNFTKIQTELNDKILYRVNPGFEPNSLSTNIDANGFRILNLPAPVNNNEPVRLIDLQNATGTGASVTVTWSNVTGKPSTFPPDSHTHIIDNVTGLASAINTKQDVLVSGTSIKTINGANVLGAGDIVISGGGAATNLATTRTSTTVTVTSDTGTDASIPAADATNAGVMSSADQVKLSGIAAGAQVNTVTSVASRTGAVVLTKTDVGLANVDNTADTAKPVSTAQQTALNLKSNLITPTFVGLRETKVAMGANDINVAAGNVFTKTITAITTLTVSNVPTTGTVATFILKLTNGGAFAVTWFTGVKWAGGTAPTLTAAGRDNIYFETDDGGVTWDGTIVKDVK